MPTFSLLAEATNGGAKIDLYIFPVVAVVIALLIWLFLWYFWRDCSDDGMTGAHNDKGHVNAPASPVIALTAKKAGGTAQPAGPKVEVAAFSPVRPSVIEPATPSVTGAEGGAANAEGQNRTTEFKTATTEEAASQFAGELSEGTVRQDPVYGILYVGKPDAADDLKLIKGVASVLEGKLNDIGVYRFKQVAVWTEPACKEFSKMMTSFKDRIYRDNWIAQAKQFHFDKYGEKL